MVDAAKRYSNQKYFLSLFEFVYSVALILIFLKSGQSVFLETFLKSGFFPNYLLIPVFFFIISISYYLLSFPINFYSGYILEHKFGLSKQGLGNWLGDQLKSGVLAYLISLIIIFAFYWTLDSLPRLWWLAISIFWILFSIVLARLAPVIIIPLFFKYKKLDDEVLRARILALAQKMKINLMDVFEIDFSKKTLKANAAFTGLGKTKRVILADTLKDKYSHDEIEVILAHEFAHYQLKHIIKLIIFNSCVTVLLFYVIFRTSGNVLGFFSLEALTRVASLPLVFLYFILFGIITQPLGTYISRRFERSADRLALKITGSKDAFVSLMNKLASQNLSDRSPHPIIKFFFFDHPPIDERIESAFRHSPTCSGNPVS